MNSHYHRISQTNRSFLDGDVYLTRLIKWTIRKLVEIEAGDVESPGERIRLGVGLRG